MLKGEIEFEKSGDIFIYLVTEEIFKTPFTGDQDTLIKICRDELEKKKVSFVFKILNQEPMVYVVSWMLMETESLIRACSD
jgi:hypothetical protein